MSTRQEQLLQLLKAQPNDGFLLFALAKEMEGANALDQALSYYHQLHQVDPTYVGLYYHLGKLYERLEAPEKAISTYRSGIQVARQAGDQHAAAELSGALLNLEDPD